ncbi:MAG: serine/threonine-protein kinase [Myxococcota bacterium]|nr:serine/threonine-protein kinase [Myxococcota bacterium]
MSGDSNPPSEPPVNIPENPDEDILSIEEVELPAKPLVVGAQGVGQEQTKYELIAGIARGGMGEIFLANRSRAGHPLEKVIIKRLLAQLRHRSEQLAMFRAEAEVMHRLDHPNIVSIVDEPIIDEQPCLAMEYIHGRNIDQLLSQAVSKQEPVPIEVMLFITIELLRGLDHVHNATLEDGNPLKLVHRDLTPGNVIISFTGDVKITDFGISKSQMSRVSTTVGIVKGKARYLAPEQIVGEPATPRSDLFACACVCAEMIQGKPLFDAPNVHQVLHAIVNGKRTKVDNLLHRNHQPIASVIEKALSTNPKKRFESAQKFRQELETARDSAGLHFSKEKLGTYLQDLFSGHSEAWEEVPVSTPMDPKALLVKSELEEISEDTDKSFANAALVVPKVTARENEHLIQSTLPPEAETHVAIELNKTRSPSADSLSPASSLSERTFEPPDLNKSIWSQLQRIWPVLFATFGLGLALGVIITLVVTDSKQRTQSTYPTEKSRSVNTILKEQQALAQPEETAEIRPLVIEPTPIGQTTTINDAVTTSADVAIKPKQPEVFYGTLTIFGPKGARVIINSKRIRKRLPLIKYKIKTGEHRVQVVRGKYRRNMVIDITRAQETKIRLRKKRKSKRR